MSGMLKRLFRAFRAAPRTVAGPLRSPALASRLIDATANGPLLVELRNAPFGEDRAAATAAVLATLARPLHPRPLSVTADPERAPVPDVRLVLAFHPAPGLSPAELARGELRTVPPGDPLVLQAVLASGAEVLASAEGWAAGLGSSADPRFAALLRQAVRDLLADV